MAFNEAATTTVLGSQDLRVDSQLHRSRRVSTIAGSSSNNAARAMASAPLP